MKKLIEKILNWRNPYRSLTDWELVSLIGCAERAISYYRRGDNPFYGMDGLLLFNSIFGNFLRTHKPNSAGDNAYWWTDSCGIFEGRRLNNHPLVLEARDKRINFLLKKVIELKREQGRRNAKK